MHEDELVDRSATGRVRPWKQHKISNEKLVKLYEILEKKGETSYQSKTNRLKECSDTLVFESCTTNPDHHKRLKKASFCKNRFCFICSWRKTLFMFHQFLAVAEHVMKQQPKYKFLFLTLTGKNCKRDELKGELTHYMQSFKRMTERKLFRDNIKGFFRTTECTYNPESDTYHPHMHCILVVPPAYFGRGYISQDRWTDLWQQSLRVDYRPIVDVRKIKPKKKNLRSIREEIDYIDQTVHDSGLTAAAAEVSKYSVKMGDIISPRVKRGDSPEMILAKHELAGDQERQAEILDTLEKAFAGRRFIGYGGILKKAYQELKMESAEQADLINIGDGDSEKQCTCPVCASELIQIQYAWSRTAQAFLYNHIVPTAQDRLQTQKIPILINST